jgi:hypothetical protein
MPQATSQTGALNNLERCNIQIPRGPTINLNVLPDISDGKQAQYSDENVIGRAFPLKTFAHGENRSISMTVHLIVCTTQDINKNLGYLRALESLVYPGQGTSSTPYVPPPIAKIQCGRLLADGPLCVVLKSYSVKFPTEVAWDAQTFLPYKLDVDLTWEVVYDSNNLPGQERIIQSGG